MAASFAVMAFRSAVLGKDVAMPAGPETWKVTLVVQGRTLGDSKFITLAPLESSRQHVLKESTHPDRLTAKVGPDREVNWSATDAGPFRVGYECFVSLGDDEPVPDSPRPGEFLRGDPTIDADRPELAELARHLTEGLATPSDRANALYEHVANEIANEPAIAGSDATAIDCFRAGRGDARAKSRLLVALMRNREIPSRVVVGLPLSPGSYTQLHVWAEAFLRGNWVAMCPTNRHFGRVPRSGLELARDDTSLARGRNVAGLEAAFLVERSATLAPGEAGRARRFFTAFSPFALPPAERHLVAFLLLLPVAALVVCVSRNVIGLTTFGTFTPALLGLAFAELASLVGVGIFVAILLMGWMMRRVLGRFQLLQVPRLAVMLSVVVCLLIGFVVGGHAVGVEATNYISLFPLVILTGMIERFWTLEEEDGMAASFRTLFVTLSVALAVGAVTSRPAVVNQMLRYPETLGVVIALQLMLGRYTGYRLVEWYRFRDFIRQGPVVAAPNLRLHGDDRKRGVGSGL